MSMVILLSLAASAAGAQTPSSATGQDGLISEPRVIEKGVSLADRWMGEGGETSGKGGFYPEMGNMITGSGWISAGPGFRRSFLNGHAVVDGSAAVSWRAYQIAQGRFELTNLAGNRLTVGSQVLWQDLTQVDYYGVGPNSSVDNRSEYELKDTDVIGYATLKANRWLAIDGTFGRLTAPTLSAPSGPFERGYPDALVTFATDPGVATRPGYLHGTASVTADTRDHPGYARTGGVYRASMTAYSDRDTGLYSFRRYEAEAVHYIPVTAETWTLAFHGWGVFSDTSSGNTVPFDMLPALGGQNTLRGYNDYRFHDRNLLLASAESRWALFRSVDVAAFFDAGNVAGTVGGVNLRKTSWGGGLRLHSPTATLARIDVGHSVEGWQLLFRLHDPFRLGRLTRRTADTPFVP